tara:strand:- start:121 stop:462 length:342 start_codon:yes stop_codon:yes gene_type:complete
MIEQTTDTMSEEEKTIAEKAEAIREAVKEQSQANASANTETKTEVTVDKKEYTPVDCGACHEPVDKWRDRSWLSVPIKNDATGKWELERIPFYIHIACTRDIHRQSTSYVKKN